MKKTSLIPFGAFVSAVLMLSSSCSKINDLIKPQDVVLNSKDIPFDIPPSAAGDRPVIVDSVPFNITDEINAVNTSGHAFDPSMIQSATVSSVAVDIVDGAGTTNNNFSNFIYGGVLLGSNIVNSPLTMAEFSDNPDVYSTHIDIQPKGTTDFAPYLKATVLYYGFSYNLRRATTKTLHLIAHVKYDIKVKFKI